MNSLIVEDMGMHRTPGIDTTPYGDQNVICKGTDSRYYYGMGELIEDKDQISAILQTLVLAPVMVWLGMGSPDMNKTVRFLAVAGGLTVAGFGVKQYYDTL